VKRSPFTPEELRKMLKLRDELGVSPEAIATRFGGSTDSVKNALSRTRKNGLPESAAKKTA